ncbi:MAG: type II toxin-antitoxin system HicB family antitoxin [bacterium]|nr:type II toxin-antitoxin system HicB family antitoxin [bacterium]
MKPYTYRIIIEPDGKFFHGYVPALVGCHTFGKTITETKKNLREAIGLYLEVLLSEKQTIPRDLSFESFETISLDQKIYA